MATMIEDDVKWYEAWLDTPITRPPCNSPAEALKTPGSCLKSREREGAWPKHFGKLVSITDDKVVVRGHGDRISPKFVWTGTPSEYARTWDCD